MGVNENMVSMQIKYGWNGYPSILMILKYHESLLKNTGKCVQMITIACKEEGKLT